MLPNCFGGDIDSKFMGCYPKQEDLGPFSCVCADPDIWVDKASLYIIFNTLLLTIPPLCSLESMRTAREIEGSISMLVFKIPVWLGNNGVDTASFQDCFVSP